jgi:hypothetical protein
VASYVEDDGADFLIIPVRREFRLALTPCPVAMAAAPSIAIQDVPSAVFTEPDCLRSGLVRVIGNTGCIPAGSAFVPPGPVHGIGHSGCPVGRPVSATELKLPEVYRTVLAAVAIPG